jgi:hypothetical protein
VFNKYIPDQEFIDYTTPFHDEEMAFSFEELLVGETDSEQKMRIFKEKEIIQEVSEAVVYEIVEHVSRTVFYA